MQPVHVVLGKNINTAMVETDIIKMVISIHY